MSKIRDTPITEMQAKKIIAELKRVQIQANVARQDIACLAECSLSLVDKYMNDLNPTWPTKQYRAKKLIIVMNFLKTLIDEGVLPVAKPEAFETITKYLENTPDQ